VYGHPLTLTATVTAGATGKVTFYDRTNVLGTSKLNSDQATLSTTLLPSGTRSLRALYIGDSTHKPATSQPITQMIVAQPSQGLLPATSIRLDPFPRFAAVGDFNGDGKPDLAIGVSSSLPGVPDILLGNGDGTFQGPTRVLQEALSNAIAVADFNGDGRVDLAVAFPSVYVSVLLGNGDGAFTAVPNYDIVPPTPSSIAAADFNGDGRVDLVVNLGNSVGILLGNGDGTFQPVVTYPAAGADGLAVADFNRDGRADVAVTNPGTSSVSILLGNGDGSLQPPITFAAAAQSHSLIAADLNNDGKPDLAVPNFEPGAISVLLGNGDGTFETPIVVPAGSFIYNIAAGDVNGDGNLDLVAPNYASTTLNVLLGNGDGTFQIPISYSTAYLYSYFVAVADFNGDGKTDVAVTSDNLQTLQVFLGGEIPRVSIAISPGADFYRGEAGATYTIAVANAGAISTNGLIEVADTLPSELSATAIAGTGWNCNLGTLLCFRTDSLGAGASYPPIHITVNVAPNAASPVVNTATVSGGTAANAVATDSTIVTHRPLRPR